MGSLQGHHVTVRYRKCLLIPVNNDVWLIRPERSPMKFLPFRTSRCSLNDAKLLIDQLLADIEASVQQSAA